MTAQKDYSRFFADLPEDTPVMTPRAASKPKVIDDFSGFFADLDIPQAIETTTSEPEDLEQYGPKKESLFDRFGQALSYQMKSGGPSGAPSLSPEQAKKVATEAGTQIAVGEVFAPLKLLAGASKYAPGFLKSLVNITQAGTTGAAVPAVESLVETGELPSKEELLKHGAIWAGMDAAIQLTHTGAELGVVINKLRKETNLPTWEVVKRLWEGAKKYYGWKAPTVDPETGAAVFSLEQIEGMTKLAEKEPETIIGIAERVESKEVKPEENLPIEQKTQEKPYHLQPYEVRSKDLRDFESVKNIASGKSHAVTGETRAKAQWIVDEMEKVGNDMSKFREIFEKAKPSSETAESQPPIEQKGGEKPTSPEQEEDVQTFESLKHIAKDRLEDPLRRAQAQWVLNEMEKEGDDIGRLQSILERMPMMWAERDGKYVPSELKGEEQGPISGYERKPTPKTVSEKIVHLAQKIKESENYIESLRHAIERQKEEIEDLKKKDSDLGTSIAATLDVKKQRALSERRGEIKGKIQGAQVDLENKKYGLRGEKEYRDRLKKDLRDLKTRKEASRVEVPLGHREKPASKKFNKRPAEAKLGRRAPVIGKQQAVARSKIIQHFRKAFKDPIRLGKISQRNVAGIHKLWSRVTRLLQDNNVETAAHEVGHNLHTLLYGGDAKDPTQQRNNINAALRPYLDELKPLALYEPFGMEGFAEFTRIYVTNSTVATEVAPKFYAKFEADLDAQYPDLRNALLEARDYYGQYLQGTPESRIRAQTEYGEDATKLDNLIDWIKTNLNLDNLKTQFLDDVFPAKRLVAEAFGIPTTEVENLKDPRNLYRSLRVLKGAIGKADVFLTHETFDATTLKRKGRGLRQILRKLKTPEEYKKFNDYLIARRVIEKAEQQIETGVSYGDALYTERKLAPKYKKMAVLLDHYNDALLTYARDGGLLSDEQYQVIKKNNMMYVPFQRVMEKEKVGAAATGGKLQAGKPIKRMKGSTRNIIAPIESVIKNTYSIIVNSEKNISGQVLAKLSEMKGVGAYIERVPTPMELKAKISREEAIEQMSRHFKRTQGIFFEGDIGSSELQVFDDLAIMLADAIPDLFLRFGPGTYPAGENIVTVFNDGKPVYYEVSPEIYEMWTKGIVPYTADIITKILRVPARALRAGAILNPKFMMKNIVRDTWGGYLFTKYGKSVKDPAGLLLDTLYAPLAQLAVAAKQAKLYVEFMKSGGGMSTMQSLDRDAVVKKLKEVRDGLSPHQVIRWLRKVAEISEESNRLAEFGRALAVEGETRLGKEIAAFAGRDLSIDFAKMGLQTKALNQIIPFWNATVQGGDKFLRTLASDEDRAEFIARAIGFILIPSLILAYLNQDDERVKEFYEEEKDFNFITFVGDSAIKIPVPFETGVLVHGITQRMFNHFVNKDPDAFKGFMGSIASATLPNFIPAFANPIIEVEANKSFFTGARIIPMAKQDLVAKYQYKNNTSVTARLLGRAMAYMLGQDTRLKAASPAIIDHFINSWGAGLGRTTVAILDEGLRAAGLDDRIPRPDQSIAERFGLDAFIARYPRSSTRSIEKFYDYYADATARQKSIKHAQTMELEEPEAIQRAYERVEKLYDYPTLKRAYKAMQMSQRAINEIWISPDLDPQTKRTLIDDLYLQQIQFAKAAVEDIEKYRLAVKDRG